MILTLKGSVPYRAISVIHTYTRIRVFNLRAKRRLGIPTQAFMQQLL